MDNIRLFLVAIPALPLFSAIMTAALGPRLLKERSHAPTILALATSFVFSLLLLNQVITHQDQSENGGSFERVYTLWTWADIDNDPVDVSAPLTEHSSGDFRIDVTLRADSLTAIMLSMVTFVSMLVAVFSIGYMHGDRGYWRFFATVSLFVFSMTMLVSVSNFLLLYVFWEAVGVCSYLLIGFWYSKHSAAAAGKKAFLVNRVGDFGFAVGLFLIWTTYGTLNYHDTLADGSTDQVAVSQALAGDSDAASEVQPGVLDEGRMTGKAGAFVGGGIALAICLLLMTGACGKSAQFPLHVWLPDAMEGPTPVSALIHAATMVTAGVYMVARCTPLFLASPDALLIVAVIGAVTATLAALIALTQFDLKRVLAYSTVSQLGYMFLALGTGTLAGISSGMFHLLTHAFFKALLFLGAGSVMHAMGNVIDMRQFGGLRKKLPITHLTFAVGCLALAGIFPLAGFWSKDAIVGSVHDKAHQLHEEGEQIAVALTPATAAEPVSWIDAETKAAAYQTLYYVALIVAFLTAFYTFRAFFLTFYGREEIPREAAGHAHESPPVMWWPLAILAVCAVLAGMGLIWFDLETFLYDTQSLAMATHEGAFHMSVAVVSTIVAVAGILVAMYLYLGDRREVEAVKRWMNFEWMTRLAEPQWVERLKRLKPVAAVDRFMKALRLGWLATCIGYVLLLIITMLAAPLLVLYPVSPYRLSLRKFFFDEAYDVLIVRPLRGVAAISFWIDRWIVDGLVNTCGRIPPKVGSLMRSLQMGLVPFYALAMVLGVLVLIVVRIVAGQ